MLLLNLVARLAVDLVLEACGKKLRVVNLAIATGVTLAHVGHVVGSSHPGALTSTPSPPHDLP